MFLNLDKVDSGILGRSQGDHRGLTFSRNGNMLAFVLPGAGAFFMEVDSLTTPCIMQGTIYCGGGQYSVALRCPP